MKRTDASVKKRIALDYFYEKGVNEVFMIQNSKEEIVLALECSKS
ncbi:hypothetical protein ACNR9V_01680 [Parageobacillus thermoglucosidasius]